jgi:hypothetical protein
LYAPKNSRIGKKSRMNFMEYRQRRPVVRAAVVGQEASKSNEAEFMQ